MAEGKGSAAFAKNIQKTLFRTKAKVLQSLGKAEKTTDEIFKSYVGNFEKQQHVATVLQKELKHYIQCVKAMTIAAKSLYETVQEVYEPEWTDQLMLAQSAKSLDMLYASYEAELSDRVYRDLTDYLAKFPDFKEKISKRSRKLLDFDNARHEYEAVQSAKKKDESKITKSRDTLSEAKHTYDELNAELHRELPDFYNHRVAFCAANLQALFQAESTFHLETGKINDQLSELASRLANEFAEGQHHLRIVASPLTREGSIEQHMVEGGGAGGVGEAATTEWDTIPEDQAVDLSVLSVQSRPENLHLHSETGDVATAGSGATSPGAAPASSSLSGSSKQPQRPAAPKNRTPSVKVAAARDTVAAVTEERGADHINASVTVRTSSGPPAQPAVGNEKAASGQNLAALQRDVDSEARAAAELSAANRTSNTSIKADVNGLDVAGVAVANRSSAAAVGGEPSTSAPAAHSANDSAVADNELQPSAASSGDEAAARRSTQESAAVDAVPTQNINPVISPASVEPSKGKQRQVIATHPYTAEDDDELTFEPGEVITLVPFEDPADQDEGWEMGVKTSDGAKGVFPANFTRPL